MAEPARATSPVQVRFSYLRKIEIDDHIDSLNVNPPSRKQICFQTNTLLVEFLQTTFTGREIALNISDVDYHSDEWRGIQRKFITYNLIRDLSKKKKKLTRTDTVSAETIAEVMEDAVTVSLLHAGVNIITRIAQLRNFLG